MASVSSLRLAYLVLAAGLLGFGGIWIWLGVTHHAGPTSRFLRVVTTGALLLAAAGVVAAVLLEARSASPW